MIAAIQRNVLGEPLVPCCMDPLTGFTRSGSCEFVPSDGGIHAVCARMTKEFLEFTRLRGNDLSTPVPEHGFPGLKPGDCWCLCASRWQEALEAGVAPPVNLAATHEAALTIVRLSDLERHSDGSDQGEEPDD